MARLTCVLAVVGLITAVMLSRVARAGELVPAGA